MAGVKRGRNDWDDIEDTEELKEILDRQHDQITKLKKENSELRSALRSQDSTPGQKSPEELAAQAAKSRASLSKNIENQMVYKKSLKGGRGKVAAEVPNLSFEEAKAILGEGLFSKAKNGPKQLQASAADQDIGAVLGQISKSLRYGAHLTLDSGLKFTYDKAGRTLKVSGFYSMC